MEYGQGGGATAVTALCADDSRPAAARRAGRRRRGLARPRFAGAVCVAPLAIALVTSRSVSVRVGA